MRHDWRGDGVNRGDSRRGGVKRRGIPTRSIDQQIAERINHFRLPTMWQDCLLKGIDEFDDPGGLEAKRNRPETELIRLARAYVDVGLTEAVGFEGSQTRRVAGGSQ